MGMIEAFILSIQTTDDVLAFLRRALDLPQILVLLLMLDATWVAWGLLRKRSMWPWICCYWILLTAKNAVDLARTWR